MLAGAVAAEASALDVLASVVFATVGVATAVAAALAPVAEAASDAAAAGASVAAAAVAVVAVLWLSVAAAACDAELTAAASYMTPRLKRHHAAKQAALAAWPRQARAQRFATRHRGPRRTT